MQHNTETETDRERERISWWAEFFFVASYSTHSYPPLCRAYQEQLTNHKIFVNRTKCLFQISSYLWNVCAVLCYACTFIWSSVISKATEKKIAVEKERETNTEINKETVFLYDLSMIFRFWFVCWSSTQHTSETKSTTTKATTTTTTTAANVIVYVSFLQTHCFV